MSYNKIKYKCSFKSLTLYFLKVLCFLIFNKFLFPIKQLLTYLCKKNSISFKDGQDSEKQGN